MLLIDERDPLIGPLRDASREQSARNAPIAYAQRTYRGRSALGSFGDFDSLDDALDPAVDRNALAFEMRARGVGAREADELATAIAHREDVIDISAARGIAAPVWPAHARPPTLFELGAMVDVLGRELVALLPESRVEIDRASLEGAALNHCAMENGIAKIRLLSTNGTTLAGRTHALVHELGHALIGIQRHDGRSYACAYGQPDYGRFFAPHTHATLCDEEALVRAIADAWLLRREGVKWSRTWPGAVDDVARDLDAGELLLFARFRLAQGLGLAHTPIAPRRRA